MTAAQPTIVYVCREQRDDSVLYVGITWNFEQRRAAHRNRDWWTPTTTMTIESEHHAREQAQARERQLIHELRPPYNVHYTGENPTVPSPSAYRRVRPHLERMSDLMRRGRISVYPEMSGNALARRLCVRRATWGQGKVSLLEAGRMTPAEDDLRDWAAETGADLDKLLLERDRVALRDAGDVFGAARLPGGIVNATPEEIVAVRSATGTIAEYQPIVIPGLAQTADYTRAWLSQPGRVDPGGPPDVEEVVALRAQRQQQLQGKTVVVAMTTAALSAVYGTVTVQRAQLDALAAAVRDGSLDVIVAKQPPAILHGFMLLDDIAIVETVANLRALAEPSVVAQFRTAMARLRRTGATGKRAVREVERARESL